MVRLRGISGVVIVLVAGCAPHERPQEPVADCPTGMVAVGGEGGGSLAVGRVCMDVTEVTTAAYGACVHAGVCTPAIVPGAEICNLARAERGDHPINCTTWDQAQKYCGWLGKRLPDDEEWIWAAQGGAAATPYPWGRTPPDATRACWDRKDRGTCPVGSAPGGASPAGVLDLVGNAAEWTRGWTGGRKPNAEEVGERGRLRGGSYQDSAYQQPIDERWADSARDTPTETATITSGLRCVVAPNTPVQEVDDSKWTPYAPLADGLPPVLAATPAALAPVRPLANLAILDHQDSVYDPPLLWTMGAAFVPLPVEVGARLGLQQHLQHGARPTALKSFRPVRWLGDAVLLSDASSYDFKLASIDPSTYRLRWQAALGTMGRTYKQVVTPRTFVALFNGDIDRLAAFALDSGREVWRVDGGPAAPFGHVKELWADGERGFLLGDRGLVAFDANTGATLWSLTLAPECGLVAAPGLLVVEDPAAYRVIDPASGAELRRIGAPKGCRWEAAGYEARSYGAVADGLLVTFDPLPAEGADEHGALQAYDLATGAARWRLPKVEKQPLVVDHDAVFLSRGPEHLVALDAATGVEQVEISIGSSFSLAVHPVGGEAGPLIVVEGNGQWVLGRGTAPVVPEAYTIRGRVVSPEHVPRRSHVNLPVRVGEKVVRTDERGRFEARGKAIGAVVIGLGSGRGPDVRGGLRVRFEDQAVFLDGSGTYVHPDIELSNWDLY